MSQPRLIFSVSTLQSQIAIIVIDTDRHHCYKTKICNESLKVLCPHSEPHSQRRLVLSCSSLAWPDCHFHAGALSLAVYTRIMPLHENSGMATRNQSWEWLTVWLGVWAYYFKAFNTDFCLIGVVIMQTWITIMTIYD